LAAISENKSKQSLPISAFRTAEIGSNWEIELAEIEFRFAPPKAAIRWKNLF
jgi:hypothetical protein